MLSDEQFGDRLRRAFAQEAPPQISVEQIREHAAARRRKPVVRQQPVHRTILAVDIEGSTRPERRDSDRLSMRAALYRLLEQALGSAGIRREDCQFTDQGDGVLILLGPQVSKTRVLDPFIPKLDAALDRHNQTAPPVERLRTRVVVHAGEIVRDAHGHGGEDLNTAFRLLDSQPAHASLTKATGNLVVIVSDVIYQSIVKHGYGRIDPASYRPVAVVAKETKMTAWVYAPGVPLRKPQPWAVRAVAPPTVTGGREAPVPTWLPADIASFTGRHHELQRLRELLGTAGRRATAVVAAIDGIGGVGKSALAVHAAHALAEQFPDGQLYVDLGGSSPGLAPLAPQEVVGRFLRALGVDGEHVPVGLEEAAARFRSLLASRRILVVLDNAASAEQVQALLPAAVGSSALITSRQILFGLEGAVRLHLEVLPLEESVHLLGQLAGGERVAAEPAAAETIALQCGFLPLALRIAGARLADRPSWPLHALAEQFADERRRLDRLQLGDLAVRASFQLSYDALPDTYGDRLAARAFRLLGLLDGFDISVPVVAALVDQPPDTVEVVLERLVDAQLLESPIPGRYRMHDLLRLFARERAQQQEPKRARQAALRRALRDYLATARQASKLVQPADLRGAATDERAGVAFSGRYGALAWLEAERGNLIAAARQAAAQPGSLAAVAVGLASALFWFLQARGYWRDWETLNQLAVQVTRRLGDRKGESRALSDLAGAYHRMGRADEAVGCLSSALRIHRDHGDRSGEQAVLGNLAIVYRESGRLDEAIASCEESLRICRESGHRYGEAIHLNTLGKICGEQRRLDIAMTALTSSLSIFEELGDAYGQGNVLANLGEVCHVAGRPEEAIDCWERSLALFREVGDRSDEAEALWRLGRALDRLGRSKQARICQREALEIFKAMGIPIARHPGGPLRGYPPPTDSRDSSEPTSPDRDGLVWPHSSTVWAA